MNTDPIADLLTRIRNAARAHHEYAVVPHSKIKESIVRILKEREFIDDFEVVENGSFKEIEIALKEGKSDITLKRVSKPGQRIYVKSTDLKPIRNGLGICIVSTSKGLMTNTQAHQQKLGGEIICEVY